MKEPKQGPRGRPDRWYIECCQRAAGVVSEVLAPLFRHHEVVLEHDGQALPDHVTCKGAFGLGQRARRRLVGHAARRALVKGPHVPFELCIWVGQILVGQDFGELGREPTRPVLGV